MSLADLPIFFKRLILHPVQVSAIAPSSDALARAMIEGLRFESGEAAVELGPGLGVFTRRLQPMLSSPEHYLGIDKDPVFTRVLRDRYPQLRFVEGLAEEVDRHVAELGLQRVRAVVSGLPFASMPEGVQRSIVQAVSRILVPDGEFRTFQYLHAYRMKSARRFRAMSRELLGEGRTSGAVWWNLPPAYVLSWRNERGG